MRKLHLWIPVAPWLLWGLGAALNVLVMSCNHGLMPYQWTQWAGGDDTYHILWTHATHLKMLADWICIPALGGIVSPGDLMILVADWLKLPAFSFWLGYIWSRRLV